MINISALKEAILGSKTNEKLFLELVLDGKITEATKLGYKLLPSSPAYVALCQLILFLKDPEEYSIRKLLELIFDKMETKSDILWFLFRRGLMIENLYHHVKKLKVKDYVYYLILKEMMFRGHHRLIINETAERMVELLLNELDDWDIYKYALENGIEVEKRETLNYTYYLLHRTKSEELGLRMMESAGSVKELEYIAELIGIREHCNGTIDCILKLYWNGYSDELGRRMMEIYSLDRAGGGGTAGNREVPSTRNTKALIAVLLSSRRIEHIVLALYISYKNRDSSSNNYELKLIFMFICRFFCFYPAVLKLVEELNIKNVQVATLAYIWLDIAVSRKIEDGGKKEEYVAYMRASVSQLRNSIRYFLRVERLSYVLDMLELIESLLGSVMMEEALAGRIVGSDPVTSFSTLLGKHCSYMFNKLTASEERSPRTPILTLYSDSDILEPGSLLKSDLFVIEDAEFIGFYNELVEYQRSLN
jgi:hypothetical protein